LVDTVFERFVVSQQLPQENTEAVHVEFRSTLLVDVRPVFRRNVTDSPSVSPAVRVRRRVLFPRGQTKVADLKNTLRL